MPPIRGVDIYVVAELGRRNVVTGQQFSEMLEQVVLRYQNRTSDAAQVVAELAELAQQLEGRGRPGRGAGADV